jgi:hypothetical protein
MSTMTLFQSFPSRAELHPVRLHSARVDAAKRFREAGLASRETELSHRGMQQQASAVKRALGTGNRLGRELRRRLPSLVIWADRVDGELGAFVMAAVAANQVVVTPRLLWALLSLHFDDEAHLRELRRHFGQMSARLRERVGPAVVELNSVRMAGRLPEVLANYVEKDRIGLVGIADALRVPAGTPLMEGIWDRLLSPSRVKWWLSQPIGEVERLLEFSQGTVRVGKVGKVLLTPLVGAGLTPGMVRTGKPLARLVGAICKALPRSQRHSAWDALGPEAAKAVRWWKTQDTLEEFFGKWNADPRRSNYWLGFVDTIRDVEAFRNEDWRLLVR